LFPELTWSESGGYAHAFSRWFNRHIDGLGLTSESLNFHAFRHGWTDAARRAHIPERNADLLGGWKAARGQAADYGNLQELTVNLEHLSTIAFGDFRLPRVTPGLSHPVRRGPRPRRAKGALVSEFRSA
jgi:hypothetical protein